MHSLMRQLCTGRIRAACHQGARVPSFLAQITERTDRVLILQNIWLLTLTAKPYDNSIATSVATQLRFGTWGWCAVGCVLLPSSLVMTLPDRPALSVLGQPLCFGPALGYSLTSPVDVAAAVGQPNLTNGITPILTFILVLHPVCAALALILLFLCLLLRNHALEILALIVAVVLGLVSGVSVAVDLALVIVAHKRIPAATNGEASTSSQLGCC
jgi:hypothetical protein